MFTSHRSRNRQRGQGLVEYGVIVALIAVIAIGGVAAMSGSVSAAIDGISSKITNVTGGNATTSEGDNPTEQPPMVSCGITASAGGQLGEPGTNGYAQSVTFTTPMIMSTQPGSAPFSFTVLNAGSIPDVLTVASDVITPPWSIIGAPFAPVTLASGATYVYDTGVKWTELGNADFGTEFTVTWTVSCGGNQ